LTLGQRERRLIAMLGVVLVAALIYRLWPLLFAAERAEDAVAAAKAVTARVDLPELRLAERAVEPGPLTPGRDPFRFGAPPAPPPPPPPTKAELEAMRLAQEQAERQRLEAERRRQIEEARPRVPPEVKYLGSFGPKNHRIAVFNDGSRIVNLSEGELLNGRFLVFKIGYESVDLKFLGFPNEPPARLPAGAPAVP
jgi:hypothetical protein